MLHSGSDGRASGFGYVAVGCGHFADEPGGSFLDVGIKQCAGRQVRARGDYIPAHMSIMGKKCAHVTE